MGGGGGGGGVYQTQGVYWRGASDTKSTPQRGRLLDTRR